MNIKVFLILFIAMLSVSTSPIIARLLVDIPAISISFWRMFIGGLLLWSISLIPTFHQKPLAKVNLRKTQISGVLLGLHFYFFFSAVKMTTIANATFLGTIAPLFTIMIEVFWLKRKISNKILVSLFIILLASTMIIIDDFNFSNNYTWGNIYAIICSLLLGIGFIISEDVRQTESTISFSRTLYMSAACTLFILSLIINESIFSNALINSRNMMGLLILGIVPTIFGHNSLYYAVKHISPSIIASVPLGEPIIASTLAFFIFNESINNIIFMSGFIIIVGLVYLINVSQFETEVDFKK